MKRYIKNLINRLLECNFEERQMINFINCLCLKDTARILDVGCGYGRNIKLAMTVTRAHIDGVDINENIIQKNRITVLERATFYTLDEFKKKCAYEYDLIIFSHVIEHFQPDALRAFLDEYLSYLKKGGHVIIATPVLWRGFYWDFDHIKMYHPIGINMVFGIHDAQVQYYAENKLELKDIWWRKTEFMVHEKRGLYIPCSMSKVWIMVNLFYKALFKFSGGFIGRTTGWMGLYRKY